MTELERVYDEISKLIMYNFENGNDKRYDKAYRDCLRIVTNILNKEMRK